MLKRQYAGMYFWSKDGRSGYIRYISERRWWLVVVDTGRGAPNEWTADTLREAKESLGLR